MREYRVWRNGYETFWVLLPEGIKEGDKFMSLLYSGDGIGEMPSVTNEEKRCILSGNRVFLEGGQWIGRPTYSIVVPGGRGEYSTSIIEVDPHFSDKLPSWETITQI